MKIKRIEGERMIYKYPDYYKTFNCIGGKCDATCCAGWEIVIDEESIEKYDDVSGEFGKRLRNSINYEEEVFFQDEKKKCAFLNGENLCDIYSNIGEEYLCHTCTNYPRHMEEFEDLNEMSLSISCPEVTKLILDRVEKLGFYEEEVEDEEEEFEEFDMLFFDILYDVREKIIEVVQNRQMAQRSGFALLLKYIFKVQEYIDRDDIFEIDSLADELYNESNGTSGENKHEEIRDSRGSRRETILCYLKHLDKLETLNEDWPSKLSAYRALLSDISDDEYNLSYNKFHNSCNIEIELEQLMVYFIYSYFCGAVYDGEALSKYLIAFINVSIIEEFWYLQWLMNGEAISRDELFKTTYTYAREIEHSDMNLDVLENLFSTHEDFELEEILNLIVI